MHQHVAEVVFRFAQGSLHSYRTFNGDPHPGQLPLPPRRHGHLPRLRTGEALHRRRVRRRSSRPSITSSPATRPGLVAAMERAGFLHAGHGLDPDRVFAHGERALPGLPAEEFTFTPGYTREAMASLLDVRGPNADVLAALDMPPSFVLLDRVVWGVSALLGRLQARNRWRGILVEYLHGADPVTELGRAERRWRRSRAATRQAVGRRRRSEERAGAGGRSSGCVGSPARRASSIGSHGARARSSARRRRASCVVAERLGHQEAPGPLGLRVAVDQGVEGAGSGRRPRGGPARGPARSRGPTAATRPVGWRCGCGRWRGCRSPSGIAARPRSPTSVVGSRVAAGELCGAALEVDLGGLAAAFEAGDQRRRRGVELVGCPCRPGLHPDDPVDDRGLHGLAPPGAVDDLDRHRDRCGDGATVTAGSGW